MDRRGTPKEMEACSNGSNMFVHKSEAMFESIFWNSRTSILVCVHIRAPLPDRNRRQLRNHCFLRASRDDAVAAADDDWGDAAVDDDVAGGGGAATGGDVTACEDSAHCLTATSGFQNCSCFYCHAVASCLRHRTVGPLLPPFLRASDGAADCWAPLTSSRRTESPDHRRFDASDDAAAVAAAGGDGVAADQDPCKIWVGSDAADGGYSASFVAEDLDEVVLFRVPIRCLCFVW